MDRPQFNAEAEPDQDGALPVSILKDIIGGATNQTHRPLNEQDALAGADLGKISEAFRDSLGDGSGRPLTAGADKYTQTKHTFSTPVFGVDHKLETVKNSTALDNEKTALRDGIAKDVATTSKALNEATVKAGKAGETLKSTTTAHEKATERVGEKAETLKIVTEHGNSKFLVDNATKAHDAAKDYQAKTAKDVDSAKAGTVASEKDLAAAKTAADAAKAKQDELDASDKKAKADKDAGKPTTKAGKVADFASKHLDKAVKWTGKGIDILAEKQAKDQGTLHEDSYTNVHSGGVVQTKVVDGNVTVEKTVFGQTVTEGSTKSYKSDLGEGGKAAWAAQAETGYEKKQTVDLGGGKSQTSSDKVYAAGAFENKASYSVNATGVTGEASSKVVVHAEYSHSQSYKDGDTTTTDTNTALVHGEAGVKVGGHLGFDGVAVEAKASAEVIVKLESKQETDYGDVKTHRTVEAFAVASAEAKVEAEARVDLTKGEIKAKGGFGAEASAGVGVKGTTGAHSTNGNGADIGGGLYAGKIGPKFETDFEAKDGKIALELEVGASFGLGASAKIQIKGDVKNAVHEVTKVTENFSEKSFGDQVLTGARLFTIETPINFIRGFWN